MARRITNSRFVFFTDPNFDQSIDKATKRGLSKWGAYVRRSARQSIRKRNGASLPGNPPYSHEGSLKRLLNFYFDRVTKSVVVGPEFKTASTNAPNVLEFGGKVLKFPEIVIREFRVGEKGPVRLANVKRKKNTFVWATLYTQKQCERAKRLYNEQMKKNRQSINALVLPRPYMEPAMMKNLRVAPDCFKATLKGN